MTRALLVAHGQPSDPGPAAMALKALAGRVADHLPGWHVTAATLAEDGALACAADGPGGAVFPLFMAGGWFTRIHIPGRLAQALGPAAAARWQMLEPLGCLPEVHDLALRLALDSGAAEVLVAAHGSFKSPVPAAIAARVAARIAREPQIRRAEAGFIDQSPRIADLRGFGPDSLCLPFFAAAGGHVTDDIPAALAEAGFRGRLAPALGLHPDVPALIARAIAAGQPACAEQCRWAPGAGAARVGVSPG